MAAGDLRATVDQVILDSGVGAGIAFLRGQIGGETGENSAAWSELLRIGRSRGDWPSADEAAQSLMSLGHPEFVVELATNHRLRGELKVAETLLADAVEAGVSAAPLHLAHLLRQRGDAGCVPMLHRFLGQENLPPAAMARGRFELAEAGIEFGRIGDALQQFAALCAADHVATVVALIDELVEHRPDLWLGEGAGDDGVRRQLGRLFVTEVCPLQPGRYSDALDHFLRTGDAGGAQWTLDHLPGIHGAPGRVAAVERLGAHTTPDIRGMVTPVLQLKQLFGEWNAPRILHADSRLKLLVAVTGALAASHQEADPSAQHELAGQLLVELARVREHSGAARTLAVLWMQIAEVALLENARVVATEMSRLLLSALPGLPASARDAIGDSRSAGVVLAIVVAEYRATMESALEAARTATAVALACHALLPTLPGDAPELATTIVALGDYCRWVRDEGIGAAAVPLHGHLDTALVRAFETWHARGTQDLASWPLHDSAAGLCAGIRDAALESGDARLATHLTAFMLGAGLGEALEHQETVVRLFMRAETQSDAAPWAMMSLATLREAGVGDFQGACALYARGYERLSRYLPKPESEVQQVIPAAYHVEIERASAWSDVDARRVELTSLWLGYGRWLDRTGAFPAAVDAYIQARAIAGPIFGYELPVDALRRAGRPDDVVTSLLESLSAGEAYLGLGDPFKLLAGVLEYRTIVDVLASVVQSMDDDYLLDVQDPNRSPEWGSGSARRDEAAAARTARLVQLTEFIDVDLGGYDEASPPLPACVLTTVRGLVQRAREGVPRTRPASGRGSVQRPATHGESSNQSGVE